MCGMKSENSMPLWPCGVKTRGLASTAAFGLVKARRRSLVSSAGSGLPCHFWSSGLGSNRSSWLGPPSMNMKMTFLALGGEVRLARRQRILLHGGAAAFALQHLRQRDGADAAGAIAEEFAAALNSAELFAGPWLNPS